MCNEIFESIKIFVIKETCTRKFPLERTTSIEATLGVTGDDAYELMINYGKQFNVDIKQFMFSDYFKNEGRDIFGGIFRFVAGKKPKIRKELTLGDLEKGVIAGRLDEEIINTPLEKIINNF